MSFHNLARLLLPIGADARAAVRPADEGWLFEREGDARVDALVCGHEPVEKSGKELMRWAALRERALGRMKLSPPGELSVTGVHRWGWSFNRPRRFPRTVGFLRSGLVVELHGSPGASRAIDAAALAAGATRPVRANFSVATGGAATAKIELRDGSEAVMRVGVEGSAADPAPAAAALRHLEPSASTLVPGARGSGTAGCVRWTAESVLPGTRAERATAGLLAELADFLLTLPRGDGPPDSMSKDLHILAAHTPGHGPALLELLERHEPVAASLPAVTRHGDLWAGNVLLDRGRLSGVVDWDGWAAAAVPGTDLIHMVAVDRAVATRASFAEVLVQRPWEAAILQEAAGRYWKGLGITPSKQVLDTVGVAWWAARTAHNVAMNPAEAADPTWISRNVAPVLASGL